MNKITVTLVKIEKEKDINIEVDAPIFALERIAKTIQHDAIMDDTEPGEYLIITNIPKVSINAHLIKRIRVGYFDGKTKTWKNDKTSVGKMKDFLRKYLK